MLTEHRFTIFQSNSIESAAQQALCTGKLNKIFRRFDLLFEMLVFLPHMVFCLMGRVLSVVSDKYDLGILYVS